MNKIADISPFILGLLTIGIVGLVILIPLDQVITDKHFTPFQIEYFILGAKMGLLLILSMITVKKLSNQALSGLSSSEKWSSKYLNIIPGYLFVIGVFSFIGQDLSQINSTNLLLLFFSCLTVGFAEEFIFRGILQPVFIKKFIGQKNGLFLGVLFPSLFFGLMHLFNLGNNENIPQVIGQVFYAIFIGFFFGVLVLKTNKLIPLAITHGLVNFFFSINQLPGIKRIEEEMSDASMSSALGPILIFLPLFIIALIVLRKIKKEDVEHKLLDD